MLHPNLYLAQQAITYVSGLGLLASNRPSAHAAWHGQNTLDDAVEHVINAFFQAEDVGNYINDQRASIKKWAELAREHQVGNCEVQACLAFDRLAKLPKRPNLELMSLVANGNHPAKILSAITSVEEDFEGPDHVFVVLGRTVGKPGKHVSWNSDAVICDPWAKRAYFAGHFADEMALIRRVSGGVTETSQMFELAADSAW